jgi:hypothetical protein
MDEYQHDSEEECIAWLEEQRISVNTFVGQMHILRCLCRALWKIMTEPFRKLAR